MGLQAKSIKRTLDELHETSWWTIFAYAYAIFMCGSLFLLVLPAPLAAALRRPLLVLPLLLIVAKDLVLRLRPRLPVTITCYQLEKTAPLYVFLYLDRPEQLASALARLHAGEGTA